MARIQLHMTARDMLLEMCEGNPGCINVLMSMLTQGDQIDPDAALGGLHNLLSLDTLEVYGSRVWMLYKDVCGQDLVKTVGVLRGWQLGFVKREQISHAIDNRGEGLDVDDVLAKVREKLPKFGVST